MADGAPAGIEALVHEDVSVQEVCERVVDGLLSVVDADSFFVLPTDPHTGLSVGGFGVGCPDGEQACLPSWEHEFLIPDYNKFADLTPAEPVGDLRRATGGRPSRSARYRTMSDLIGLREELRATLTAGGRPWGKLQLGRRAGGAFTERDAEVVRAVAPLAGAALRRALLREPVVADRPGHGPGVVLVDGTGAVLGTTAEADAWLDELRAVWQDDAPGHRVHPELLALAVGTLERADLRSRRMRLRTPRGAWLVAYASPLGDTGQVTIVVEPARSATVAPVVMEACRLTPREIDVTLLLARGLPVDDVAATLCLSPHTVRDHLKSIYDKVGVRSRAELTAALFTDPDH